MLYRLTILTFIFVSVYGCATHQVNPIDTRSVETYTNRAAPTVFLLPPTHMMTRKNPSEAFTKMERAKIFFRYSWYSKTTPMIA